MRRSHQSVEISRRAALGNKRNNIASAGVPSSEQCSHFLITRFNVRSRDVQTPPDSAWLQRRLPIFRDICVESVHSQTDKDFEWLVFFDGDTPEWARSEIESIRCSYETPAFSAVYIDHQFSADAVAQAIADRSCKQLVLTSRLDNDDALASDFIKSVHDELSGSIPRVLNFVDGIQLAGGHIYSRPYNSNPFITLVERNSTQLLTVFADQHDRIERVAPIQNIRTSHPMWAQNVHGNNMANEVVGIRIASRNADSWFNLPVLDDRYPEYLKDRLATSVRAGLRILAKPSRIRALIEVAMAKRAFGGSSQSTV